MKLDTNLKTLAMLVATLGGLVAMLNFCQAKFVIPEILIETREQTKEMIQDHSQNPHPMSVGRPEFKMMVDEIRASRSDFNRRLDAIDEKVSR